ncbi:hypothetical protein N0B44_17715 [Roseibacterium beibuensis]|uniref:hypothetical protein n=1 Tax=[Roseibacterium] beibuensis TaxID=1193142 RepID=UPI00217E6794|nr:hypothetical protein [Roseibacterium beibuensis]MCS6624757.1 hypothetical protein [Roseibacterium beibuensis]
MKRSLATTAAVAAMVLAGCSGGEPAEEAVAAGDVAAETSAPATEAEARIAPPAGAASAMPAAAGAPAFAVIYPGAELKGPATVAQSPVGPGGIVQFTTDADPETVIAFYRQRAEAAGLKQINSMNRGDAQAYSAGDGANGRGQLMQVIATRIEEGPTDVQLDWTSGK